MEVSLLSTLFDIVSGGADGCGVILVVRWTWDVAGLGELSTMLCRLAFLVKVLLT
jgi:hypothetical protein